MYAIFVGGEDDAVVRISNNASNIKPRDNVYLEFGIYAGILSPSRTYFLMHQNCTAATDFSGITIEKYSNLNDVDQCCGRLRHKIEQEEECVRIVMLPSTSLAVGYYMNFLKPLSEVLSNLEQIQVDGISYPIKGMNRSLEVVIPNSVVIDLSSWAK